jgi:enediyne biosynthesis protein E4
VPGVVSFIAGRRVEAAAPVLAGDTASIGPMAMADVNGDGFLDLFVGARAIPGAWPLPARSRLLLGSASGAYTDDAANVRAVAALGLVSAAVFTDLDGDARPELVVATEFGPLRVLQNDRGVLRDVTKATGLSDRTSRWNGVAAGDFDGDGRMDLVATSWGRNVPWQASAARPHTLVIARVEEDRLGLLFARRDSVTGKEMPLDGFARIGAALPSVKSRFATFAEFAAADVEALLGDKAAKAVRIGATSYEHIVLLNRGGRFEVRALPTAAQLAPAFGAVVADWDADGKEDLFLSQNFFPTEINSMRFDAGTGLVLLGDGTGGFAAQTTQQSGIAVRGDQRGGAAADFDGDGRVDLAVAQNGAAMTLWRNTGAPPGLRVQLRGPAANPLAIGASVQLRRGTVIGPRREIRAGSGYWSMDAATVVLAPPAGDAVLLVRWPGGTVQEAPVRSGQRTITVPAER